MAEPTALELETLTYTILGETRGEGVDGMSMVANVIRNRAESGLYSSSPYEVALEPSQFSTHNSGKGGNQTSTRAEVPVGSALYKQAEEFCKAKGGVMVPINSTAKDSGMGTYASAEIQFMCLPPDDPRVKAAKPTL